MFNGLKTALTAVTAIAFSASVASAGGLADQIVETVEEPMEVAPAESSVPGWVIPVAIVALLIGVAASGDDDDDDDDRRRD